jgi:O-antigen ligase
MFSKPVHQTIHMICLILTAFFMPVSVWMLSAVSIALSVNWLAGADLHAKIKTLSQRGNVLILLLLFAMYIVWLFNTSEFRGAIHELQLKLPLLAFPVIIGSSPVISKAQLKMLLLSFICGCLVSVAAGFMALGGIVHVEFHTTRDLALFLPSIRLSLLLNFAIFSSLWILLDEPSAKHYFKAALGLAALAMAYFLFRLLSVTGIIIFIILLGLTGIFMLFIYRRPVAGLTFVILSVALISGSVIMLSETWHAVRIAADPQINEPLETTVAGNDYTHFTEEAITENGYLIWMNICEKELRKEWNRRSDLDYDGADLAGNELRVTLIRYITFLGMAKDSAAVASLSGDDIRNIERGFANPLYARPGNPKGKAYELCWQIDRALKGSNPSGHSVTQRIEFYRASIGIIRKNPWLGVGTGDIRKAFSDEYKVNNTPLIENYRRMISHNQYLGFVVCFGIPGALIALAVMLLPWLRSRRIMFYPFILFISIIFLSMFNDDTFSSSIGATFFSYFYTLLLVVNDKDETWFRGKEVSRAGD